MRLFVFEGLYTISYNIIQSYNECKYHIRKVIIGVSIEV